MAVSILAAGAGVFRAEHARANIHHAEWPARVREPQSRQCLYLQESKPYFSNMYSISFSRLRRGFIGGSVRRIFMSAGLTSSLL
jgi:hypothetical protein